MSASDLLNQQKWHLCALHWVTAVDGGRRFPPIGPTYASVAYFDGDPPTAVFSVIVRFRPEDAYADPVPAELALLAPDRLPGVVSRLTPPVTLVVVEGWRVVARVGLLEVC